MGVQVGTLEYTLNLMVIIIPAAVCGAIVIAFILVALIVLCVCYDYKSKRSKEQAEARELRELVEREREMNKKQKIEFEQQVENMVSQVTMVHSQMKGGWCESCEV